MGELNDPGEHREPEEPGKATLSFHAPASELDDEELFKRYEWALAELCSCFRALDGGRVSVEPHGAHFCASLVIEAEHQIFARRKRAERKAANDALFLVGRGRPEGVKT